ncbi:MAG: ribbon-helix-helix domain-containing protein [Lachnospiraceae bacterium]|nr:ribbon-helix-helix domain-containing protein [Lachnospiraceae bacterium]
MSRAKKDGKFLNCYIDKSILDKLEEYCDVTSVPKTSVVEKALQQYLMQFEVLMKKNDQTAV